VADPPTEPQPFVLNPHFAKAIGDLYRAFVDAYVASLCTLAVEVRRQLDAAEEPDADHG
jgi:hypothetical protein